MEKLKNRLNMNRWLFQWRYIRNQTPWDTNITPPEVVEFIARSSPGKAVDLGCGTGTNAITLARHGWEVTGVDFSSRAIRKARQKAEQEGMEIDFHVADVTELGFLTETYDYGLDIGCMFTLSSVKQNRYAETLQKLLNPGACLMIYAWLPRPWKGGIWGISPEEVDSLLSLWFLKTGQALGEEGGHGSAWYWFEKKSA